MSSICRVKETLATGLLTNMQWRRQGARYTNNGIYMLVEKKKNIYIYVCVITTCVTVPLYIYIYIKSSPFYAILLSCVSALFLTPIMCAEIFVDVIENIDAIIDRNGTTISAEIDV